MPKNKLKLHLIALADQVITSQQDKKNSLIGIFDKIFVENLPAVHNKMTLYIVLSGEMSSREKINVVITKPSGQEELNRPFEFSFGLDARANIILNLEGFPIKEIGQYKITIYHQKNKLGEYVFD